MLSWLLTLPLKRKNAPFEPILRGSLYPGEDGGGGGGRVFPYIGYTGMCPSRGYSFCFSVSGTGYKNHPLSLAEEYILLQIDSGTGLRSFSSP